MTQADPDRRVQIGILGPLFVTVGPRSTEVSRPKVRALLAFLSLSAGRVVGSDDIEAALWGSDPPPSARKLVQTYVARLRVALPPATVVTRAPGYELQVARDDVDALRFESKLRQARREVSDLRRADHLDAALREWRGHALEDVSNTAFALPAAARLETERLDALESCAAIRLQAGDVAPLVPRLAAELECQPYRERLAVLLMLALDRLGRAGEALRLFDAVAGRLRRDLGLAPGPELVAVRDGLLHSGERDGSVGLSRHDGDRPGDWVTVLRVRMPAGDAHTGLVLRGAGTDSVTIQARGELRVEVPRQLAAERAVGTVRNA